MLGGAMYAWERAFKRPDGSVPFWAKLEPSSLQPFAVVATRVRVPPSSHRR